MNLIKTLRKPYFATFFASLILFVSCSPSSIDSNEINIDTFAKKHIETSNKIMSLIKNENIDYRFIESHLNKTYLSLEELNEIFKSSGVKNHQKLTSLFSDIYNNGENFITNNPNTSIEEIEQTLILEYDKYYGTNDFQKSCQSTYEASMKRCSRNFWISMGVSAVGLLAGGVGGAIGALVATINLAECENSANETYQDCIQ